MQILLALIFGAAYGAVLHYTMPGRASRGVALAPIVGAVLGGLTWLVMTWLGFTLESPWLWLVSVIVPVVVVPVALTVLRRVRDAHDARERVRLRIA
ncbi:hypothetical protein [Microbacterium invictum]|uniref:Membrane protein YeaQ/YmgE (Transglycosylase-associated protein family) n=1 Tax=Microbacterium invictum TaxID=515415 RepID=A0AA40VKS1_9MICO|nr:MULTISPECIES: hypothetical protein [Microbacterium]MBB4138779.1 putative membrane protein YeaQ/YmgE (transglycosylase-associated protein family) [Microbacterium invictum]